MWESNRAEFLSMELGGIEQKRGKKEKELMNTDNGVVIWGWKGVGKGRRGYGEGKW